MTTKPPTVNQVLDVVYAGKINPGPWEALELDEYREAVQLLVQFRLARKLGSRPDSNRADQLRAFAMLAQPIPEHRLPKPVTDVICTQLIEAGEFSITEMADLVAEYYVRYVTADMIISGDHPLFRYIQLEIPAAPTRRLTGFGVSIPDVRDRPQLFNKAAFSSVVASKISRMTDMTAALAGCVRRFGLDCLPPDVIVDKLAPVIRAWPNLLLKRYLVELVAAVVRDKLDSISLATTPWPEIAQMCDFVDLVHQDDSLSLARCVDHCLSFAQGPCGTVLEPNRVVSQPPPLVVIQPTRKPKSERKGSSSRASSRSRSTPSGSPSLGPSNDRTWPPHPLRSALYLGVLQSVEDTDLVEREVVPEDEPEPFWSKLARSLNCGSCLGNDKPPPPARASTQ